MMPFENKPRTRGRTRTRRLISSSVSVPSDPLVSNCDVIATPSQATVPLADLEMTSTLLKQNDVQALAESVSPQPVRERYARPRPGVGREGVQGKNAELNECEPKGTRPTRKRRLNTDHCKDDLRRSSRLQPQQPPKAVVLQPMKRKSPESSLHDAKVAENPDKKTKAAFVWTDEAFEIFLKSLKEAKLLWHEKNPQKDTRSSSTDDFLSEIRAVWVSEIHGEARLEMQSLSSQQFKYRVESGLDEIECLREMMESSKGQIPGLNERSPGGYLQPEKGHFQLFKKHMAARGFKLTRKTFESGQNWLKKDYPLKLNVDEYFKLNLQGYVGCATGETILMNEIAADLMANGGMTSNLREVMHEAKRLAREQRAGGSPQPRGGRPELGWVSKTRASASQAPTKTPTRIIPDPVPTADGLSYKVLYSWMKMNLYSDMLCLELMSRCGACAFLQNMILDGETESLKALILAYAAKIGVEPFRADPA